MSKVDEFVSNLLSKHDILNYRTLFSQEQYSKKTMHKSNDHIIKPLTLTPHEKSLPPELTVIALSKFHSRIAHPDARLHSILSLETLKKKTNVYDTQFHQNVASPNKKPPPALQQKGEKRRRKSQISGYDGDDVFDDDSFQKKPRVRASGDRVRKLDAAGSHGSGDTSSAVCASSGAGGTGYAERAATIPLEVLQPQLEAVFQVFWELELAPPALATPFFGLVTRANCDVLGLPRFFDKVLESCSLANISEKLKSRAYLTLDSFEADFSLMFSNICAYFPEASPQHAKAKELQALFRDRWTHVLLDLKKI